MPGPVATSSRLADWLWGAQQQRAFSDPVLGVLCTMVRPRREPRWCAWHGEIAVAGHSTPAHVSLGGDASAPDRWQLEVLHTIVAGLDAIDARAAAALAACAPPYPLSAFRLASLSCWDDVDDVFEIRYEPLDKSGPWPNVETTWTADDSSSPHIIVVGKSYRVVDDAGRTPHKSSSSR